MTDRSERGDEFPPGAAVWEDPIGRRQFLKLMGASLALAGVPGLAACTRQPEEKIVPYARPPEEVIPGKPLYFATALTVGGYATGVLVESHMGRPTKVEGNPKHPASLGATTPQAQAAVLGLYDPDRSQVVTHLGEIRSLGAFSTAVRLALEGGLRAREGAGLRILTETVTSPTLAGQIGALREAFPKARWHAFDPLARTNAREAARIMIVDDVDVAVRYDVAKADKVLALDSDFLAAGPGALAYARAFASRRHAPIERMSRLYAVESTPTPTGSMADHRLPLAPRKLGDLALAVAHGGKGDGLGLSDAEKRFAAAVAADLERSRGASLVVAGEGQSLMVHIIAHFLNHFLENVGKTVFYTEPVEASGATDLASLVADMDAGQVEMLVILGGNPVFTAPPDLRFAERMRKVALRVHLGLYQDETAALCHWHVPMAHELESWSDARAFDGTATILQPLIAPLYGGRTAHELLATLLGTEQGGYEIVRKQWRQGRSEADFERFWHEALRDGVVPGTAARERAGLRFRGRPERVRAPRAVADDAIEVVFRPDPHVLDGRFANNGWLQELPKPITKLTWDNAVLVSPALAADRELSNEDVVELELEGRRVEGPVWIVPGQAARTVTLHLGYGRTRAGRAGTGAGFDANVLRSSAALDVATGLSIKKTRRRYPLACTQGHQRMEGRELARWGPLPEVENENETENEKKATLYPDWPYEGYAWGMAIDLGACLGCNACVVACQAENNIPVVGKPEVLVGREMHWIRVDTYFEGDDAAPRTIHQPVPCMHCEHAPCEVVCPVAATTHSDEGLNEMTYNRCVGTRYCSNNCPYKVRRFNFLQYTDLTTPVLSLLRNPDVTVRTRGVMEKCTYCVQRINAARIDSKIRGTPIQDGEVVTACQSACPTEAIVFGDLNRKDSKVARMKRDPLHYALLGELNTRPRTTYLARLRNPNQDLED